MQISPRVEEPSLVAAAERVIDAGQRIIVDRIDLARLEALNALSAALLESAMLIAGGFLAAIGWIFLSAGAVLALHQYAGSWATGGLLVGLANLMLGGLVIVVGRSRSESEAGSNSGPQQ